MPSIEQIVQNLNLTGNFLEAAVFRNLVDTEGFLATTEWPFSGHGFEGAADIVAMYHRVQWDTEPLVIFTIERKKVRNNQKIWVFDSTRTERDPQFPVLKFDTDQQPYYENRTMYNLPTLNVLRAEDAPIYNKAYELRDSDANLSRDQSEKVYSALTQANKAFAGIANSGYREIFNIGSPENFFSRNDVLLVPVVITNADLKVLEYSPDNVSLETGELAVSELQTSDRDWLIFDYPLPDELRVSGVRAGGQLRPVKRPTFVISASHAVEVLLALCNDSER